MSPTIPCTRGIPIKPTLLKITAKRSTFFRPSGSFRKVRRLMPILMTMDRVEIATESSISMGFRSSPALRNEETIKQGVTILISSEVNIPRLVTKYPTAIMISITATFVTIVSKACISTFFPFYPAQPVSLSAPRRCLQTR